mgnify:CR=1 FL=1
MLNLPHESYVVANSCRSYNGLDRNTLLDGFMKTFVGVLSALYDKLSKVFHHVSC